MKSFKEFCKLKENISTDIKSGNSKLFSYEELTKNFKPMYVAIRPSKWGIKRLERLVKELKIPNPVDDFHCTILYSRKPINPNIDLRIDVDNFECPGVKLEKFGTYLVLLLDSPQLQERHKELMEETGASYDFPEYQPHITLSENFEGNMPELKDKVIIEFSEEYSEELDETK